MQLKEHLPHVDGTSICHLRSKKTPSNNTTGVKGVYLIRGKYVAKIVFQKKQYLLGSFERLEEAAEEMINDRVVAFYNLWKTKADADGEWAERNPISINILRRDGELLIDLLPAGLMEA